VWVWKGIRPNKSALISNGFVPKRGGRRELRGNRLTQIHLKTTVMTDVVVVEKMSSVQWEGRTIRRWMKGSLYSSRRIWTSAECQKIWRMSTF